MTPKPFARVRIKRVLSVVRHRNGVCGMGFWVVIFVEKELGKMVATVFDTRNHCAVLQLLPPNNSFDPYTKWRGDWFEDKLRRAIWRWERKNAAP